MGIPFSIRFIYPTPSNRANGISGAGGVEGWWSANTIPPASTDIALSNATVFGQLQAFLENTGGFASEQIDYANLPSVPCFFVNNELVNMYGLPVGFIATVLAYQQFAQTFGAGTTIEAHINGLAAGPAASYNANIDLFQFAKLSRLQLALLHLMYIVQGPTVLGPGASLRGNAQTGQPVLGEYEIFAPAINVTSPPNINSGDQVTVTVPTGGLQNLTQLKVQYIDEFNVFQETIIPPVDIIQQTEFYIIFIITFINQPQIIELVGEIVATTFSGWVTLGQLQTIFFTGGSGIYQLVPGKANDTLYVPGGNGQLIDVRIPDPFAKTGFIGG